MALELGTQYMVSGTIKWANLNPSKPGKGFDPGDFQWDFDFTPEDPAFMTSIKDSGWGSMIKTDKEGAEFIKIKRATTTKDGQPSKPFEVVSKYAGPDGKPMPWDWAKFPALGNGTKVRLKFFVNETSFGRKKFFRPSIWGLQVLELVEYTKGGEDFDAISGGETWE